MSVTRHADGRAFLAASEAVLARDEGTGAAVSAWVRDVLDHPPPPGERLYFATYASNGALGAAFQRRDHAVFVAHSDPAAAAAFAHDLAGEWSQLQGVAGAGAACEAFADAWKSATGRSHRLRFHLRSHVLAEVLDVPAPAGEMRAAEARDVDWLVAAQIAFIEDARLPDDPERVRARLSQRVGEGWIRIWDHGAPVAFAGWSPCGAGAARIAPVWSARASRRRGYATALVAALARELLASGRRRVFLDADVANATSNALYARVGFRPLRDFYHFDFVAA